MSDEPQTRASSGLGKLPLWREPLLHFVVLGGLLFAAAFVLAEEPEPPPRRIVLSEAHRAELEQQWRERTGTEPSAADVDLMVRQWIDREILFREAIGMELHQDDMVVRNQVISKLTIAYQNLAKVPEVSEQDLRDYLEDNRDTYSEPARYDVVHMFAPQGPGARAEVEGYLAEVEAGAKPLEVGPRYPKGRRFRLRSHKNLVAVFGDAFADALVEQDVGDWKIRQSDRGWHAIQIKKVYAPKPADFDALRGQLEADYERFYRQSDVRRQVLRLREQYEVEFPDGSVMRASELPEQSVGAPTGIGGGNAL